MVLLYDRDCGFCRWSAALIARRAPTVTAQAIQSAEGQRALDPLAPSARLASVHTVSRQGIASGGDALAELLGELRYAKTAQRAARGMPRITSWVYEAVAARRRLLGKLVGASAQARADDYLRSATVLRSEQETPPDP